MDNAKQSSVGGPERITGEVIAEFSRACCKYPPFNSAHEGYAILLEEVEELWAEVMKKGYARNPVNMRQEAIQIAAMAMRFAMDLT